MLRVELLVLLRHSIVGISKQWRPGGGGGGHQMPGYSAHVIEQGI